MNNKFIDSDIYDDIKSGMNVVSGNEYKQMIYSISQLASDFVVKTLGPYGQTTVIDDSTFVYPSKDGWVGLNKLRFHDPIYNTIYTTLKNISFSVVSRVGDGSTSAFIGANAFLQNILEYLEDKEDVNYRQSVFLKILNDVKDEYIKRLKESNQVKYISKDNNFEDIKKIALISSNGNEELSEMIRDIYVQTENPHIYVYLDRGATLQYEIQKGFKFEAKTLNHGAYVNTEDGICVKDMQDTMVAIFDHSLNYNTHGKLIESISRYAGMVRKEIIIIAPYFDDIICNVIDSQVMNFVKQNMVPNIMLMQVPNVKEIHRLYMADLAMLTGSQMFTQGIVQAFNIMVHNSTAAEEDKIEDPLLDLDQFKKYQSTNDIFDDCLGIIKDIVITDKYAVVRKYESVYNEQYYNEVFRSVKDKYEQLKMKADLNLSHISPEFMDIQQRYVKLIGNMGIIKVGGETSGEASFLKDVVDDTTLACKSAFENGYIKGLNVSSMIILNDMVKEESDQDRKDVIGMLLNTFKEMAILVMRNKCSDFKYRNVTTPNPIEHEVFTSLKLNLANEGIIETCIEKGWGYNLVTESFEDDENLTVINSVSTDIEIVKAMISLLSLILTSSQFLTMNKYYDKKAADELEAKRQRENLVKKIEVIMDTLNENMDVNDALFKIGSFINKN